MSRQNSGRPGGNPNIRNIRKTGPTTPEGKLKALITSNVLLPTSKSKILNLFKFCDKCPLQGRVDKKMIKGTLVELSIPAKCVLYERGQDCKLDQADMIAKLGAYYKIGTLEGDSMKLQEAYTYDIISNAEISKEAEIVQYRKPGYFTAKFQELAIKNMESVNKLKYGERHLVATADVTGKVGVDEAIKKFIDKREKAGDEDG